eukprot:TRINITY_DN10901_c0_g1_i3.p1 TRINITY_DN10901_c0_g1~~TRINITY_DN10901_c0_g1_i3.p1  ORF type:complete len:332 (-),score=63.11 TRINITY_DN10901_c0_g1_i3:87-1082(-)
MAEWLLRQTSTAGMACGIVKRGELVWSRGFGAANISRGTQVTPDTIFPIASVTKTITSVAMHMLTERGMIDLDAPISDYLSFRVAHPRYGDTEITPRMILTHHSSITDAKVWLDKEYDGYAGCIAFSAAAYEGDHAADLESVMRDYLVPGGRLYDAASNFADCPPGVKFHYSNVAVGLLGVLVQAVTGSGFSAWCQENIFQPLGMRETFWFYEDFVRNGVTMDKFAMPYQRRKFPGTEFGAADIPVGFMNYPEISAGNLYTSVRELAKFVGMLAGRGESGGVRLLQESTFESMISKQADSPIARSPEITHLLYRSTPVSYTHLTLPTKRIV